MVCNKVLASAISGRFSATARAPNAASPVTAESSVKDGKVVLEELGWVTARRRPMSEGRWPGPRHRSVGGDIGWDGGTREEPDGNASVNPLHGVDTAVDIVEALTIVVAGARIEESAAIVAAVGHVAVGTEKVASGRMS